MNNKIRVGHLITNFAVGGAQDYLLLIVRGLDQSRFEPFVSGRMEGEWVPVVQNLKGVQLIDIPSLRREISPLNDIRAVFEIRRFCKEQRIDILHTHSSKPGVVARLAGHLAGVKGVVHTVHGFSFNDFMPSWKRKLFVALEKVMSRFTTTLLLYSDGDRKTANRLGIGAARSVETFYYGIDYNPFQQPIDRCAVRKGLGYTAEDIVIGFSGRFSEQKALHILIEAFVGIAREFSHARLLLVGDGHLRRDLENQAARLGVADKVVMTGFRSDVPQVLAAMDLFIMTSFWEGLSRSLAEAMYARLPIIATDVGGTSDAVRNGETGWLIPPNNVNAAARAMREALTNPELARTFASNGYAWARAAFDLQTMHKRIADLYESLMVESRT